MEVTKDFKTFVDSIWDINHHEICQLYQVASGECSTTDFFSRVQANGSDDVLLIYEPGKSALRLNEKARAYFPTWIEENLMHGMDVDSFYGMKCAMARDEEQEEREERRTHPDNIVR